MKKVLASILFAVFLFDSSAFAGQKATPQEAIAMVKKAAQYLKDNGKEKAFAAFNDSNGPFVDRELYIAAYTVDGLMLAHGGSSRIRGKNVIDLKDVDGKYLIKEGIRIATTAGSGWFDFKWPNPVTKQIEPKSVYVEKADDIIISCGIYK